MNYREVEILSPTDLGAAGTEPIDIKLDDVVSSIELIWRTTVVTVSDMLDTHLACLSKIELVDGSDVLFSLSGEQAQALAFYGHGVPVMNDITVVAADVMTSVIPIHFGRRLFDPELAFDPKKFKNPQLRVTWNEDAHNTSVVVNELAVRGFVFDEKPVNPKGFLMSKVVENYTPVASSWKYVDLPVDYPHRLIMMQLASADKNPFEVLDMFKLSENHDKRVPFQMTGYEIFRKFVWPLGPMSQKVRLNETAADAMALHLAPTYLQSGQVDYDWDVIAADDETVQLAYAGNTVTVTATVNAVPYLLSLEGYAPHFCWVLPFGNLNDLGDLYRLKPTDSLRLSLQGASAVGTSPVGDVISQQVRSY